MSLQKQTARKTVKVVQTAKSSLLQSSFQLDSTKLELVRIDSLRIEAESKFKAASRSLKQVTAAGKKAAADAAKAAQDAKAAAAQAARDAKVAAAAEAAKAKAAVGSAMLRVQELEAKAAETVGLYEKLQSTLGEQVTSNALLQQELVNQREQLASEYNDQRKQLNVDHALAKNTSLRKQVVTSLRSPPPSPPSLSYPLPPTPFPKLIVCDDNAAVTQRTEAGQDGGSTEVCGGALLYQSHRSSQYVGGARRDGHAHGTSNG